MNEANDRNRRILLVDDQEQIHEDYRKILSLEEPGGEEFSRMERDFFGDEESGEAGGAEAPAKLPRFELVSARQGREALELVQAAREEGNPFALTFMDVRMPPGWDGVETTRRIREVDDEIQVILSTAYADYVWEDIHAIFGPSDDIVFMRKPFDSTEVQQLASTMTEKWNLARQARLKLGELEALVVERTSELQATLHELQEAQTQLVQAEKMASLGKLVAGITHEVSTPMGVVISSSDVIRRAITRIEELLGAAGALPEGLDKPLATLRETVDSTGQAGRRIFTILESLRRFVNLDQSDYQAVDLHANLDTTLDLLRHEMGERIRVRREYGDLPKVHGYPGQLNQLFLNLLSNAVAAIEEGREGEIILRTSREGERITLEVRDTGRGIEPELLESIFEVQISRRHGKRVKLGMGLSTCRRIVDLHGGEITVQSEPGRGTAFHIRLPLHAPRG